MGLARNPAFWAVTLGMAAGTFSLGGIQVWMPTFLSTERGYSLTRANELFGIIVVVCGIVASLAGGWLGDHLLPRMKGAYYFVSALSMALGVPVMIVALFVKGPIMLPAIALAAFFLLVNTSPLNTALVNAVGAHIRATAIAVNIFLFHLLGDVPSPTLMGYVADHHSLQAAFILPVIAMAFLLQSCFTGCDLPCRWADRMNLPSRTFLLEHLRSRMHWQTFHWIAGGLLALAWFSRIVEAALGMPRVADIALPAWDRKPATPSGDPRVSVIVPARNEEESIGETLRQLLVLDYSNYEIIAVNDRSTDRTGAIMDEVFAEIGVIEPQFGAASSGGQEAPAPHGCG